MLRGSSARRRAMTWVLPAICAGALFSLAFSWATRQPAQTAVVAESVPAVVVASASCVQPGAHDLVEVRLDGQARRLPLEGCGSPVGETLSVVLPSGVPSSGLMLSGSGGAQPTAWREGTGSVGTRPPEARELRWVLLALAAIGGAGLVARPVRRPTVSH